VRSQFLLFWNTTMLSGVSLGQARARIGLDCTSRIA